MHMLKTLRFGSRTFETYAAVYLRPDSLSIAGRHVVTDLSTRRSFTVEHDEHYSLAPTELPGKVGTVSLETLSPGLNI